MVWERTWKNKITVSLWQEWSSFWKWREYNWVNVTPITVKYEHAGYGAYSELTLMLLGFGVMVTYWWEGLN